MRVCASVCVCSPNSCSHKSVAHLRTTHVFNYRSAIAAHTQTFLNRKESKSASATISASVAASVAASVIHTSQSHRVLISKRRSSLAFFSSFLATFCGNESCRDRVCLCICVCVCVCLYMCVIM